MLFTVDEEARCPEGKEWSDCGTPCRLTCDNYENPPFCLQGCAIGCFCPEGMVEDGERCVLPTDCQTETGEILGCMGALFGSDFSWSKNDLCNSSHFRGKLTMKAGSSTLLSWFDSSHTTPQDAHRGSSFIAPKFFMRLPQYANQMF